MKYKVIPIEIIIVEHEEEIADVPCMSVKCTECCEKLSPYLTEQEFQSGKYISTFIDGGFDRPVIAVPKTEHGCIYLDRNKQCTIYDIRPIACRQFDCRKGHHPKITNKFV